MYPLQLIFLILLYANDILSFNIDEINSIYYSIDILGEPLQKGKLGNDKLMMVNRLGQEYACSLPPLPDDVKQGKKDDQVAQEESIDISVLLKPMEGAPCLITTKDWWTYEFCYGHIIKQYHLEDGTNHGAELILGKYESEYDWSSGGRGGADVATGTNHNTLQRFHSQFYSNGTKCDLTSEPRKTEVRFKCESDVGDYIERVDEPESCRYIVTVATTRVCHHPYLRPHPDRDPNPITCAPVLDADRYHSYNMAQQRRKAGEAEELAKKKAASPDRIGNILTQLDVGDATESDPKTMIVDASEEYSETADYTMVRKFLQNLFPLGKTGPEATPEGGSEQIAPVSSTTGKSEEVAQSGDTTEPNELQDSDVSENDEKSSLSASPTSESDKENNPELPLTEKNDKDSIEEENRRNLRAHLEKIKLFSNKNSKQDKVLHSNKFQLDSPDDHSAMLEIHEQLESTLTKLEEEMSALLNDASTRQDDTQRHFWRSLTDRAEAIRRRAGLSSPGKEPEKGTPEWFTWWLKKQQKLFSKAQDAINILKDSNALPNTASKMSPQLQDKEEEEEENAEERKNENEREEETVRIRRLSGQSVDEIIAEYTADLDAGSKEGEKYVTSSKLDKEVSSRKEGTSFSSIKESLKERMKESGIDLDKNHIELTILTADGESGVLSSADDELLSPEQARTVQSMFVRLMGRHREEIVEEDKHNTLNTNYNLVFDEDELSGDEHVMELGGSNSIDDVLSTGSDGDSSSELGGDIINGQGAATDLLSEVISDDISSSIGGSQDSITKILDENGSEIDSDEPAVSPSSSPEEIKDDTNSENVNYIDNEDD